MSRTLMSPLVRHIVAVTILLTPVVTESAHTQEQPNWEAIDWGKWTSVRELLENVRAASGIPAIAAVVVQDTAILDIATVGVRTFGTKESVAADDRFHLGSVTKSMTALMIGKLVDDGILSWQTTVADVLPDIHMRNEYRHVTLDQLLHHQGAIPSWDAATDEQREVWYKQRTGTPTEQRAAFLADLLMLEPTGTPGKTTLYSNAGYALAGYMAERATGQSWESLIRRYVFEPLHMTHSGLGHPGTAALPNQPRGHDGMTTPFRPVADNEHPPMDIIAPAGNVNASIGDLARYAMAQLSGLNGQDGVVRATTMEHLHSTAGSDDASGYACGWILRHDPDGEIVHYHGGTTGTFYAEVRLYPDRDAAVAVLTNVGLSPGEMVANKVAHAMIDHYCPRASTPASESNASATPSSTEFKMSRIQVGTGSGAWSTADTTIEVIKKATAPSAQDDARTWAVIKRLAETINDEDRDAFLSLFANNKPGNAEIFQFMAERVLPMRGSIRSFHALGAPITIPDSKFPVRTVIFHLENGFPGYFGLSLDDNGKIDNFSLFVKGELCPNGTDTQCDKTVKTLGKNL